MSTSVETVKLICICGKSYASTNTLLRHERGCVKSPNFNPWICEKCSKVFKTSGGFNDHWNTKCGIEKGAVKKVAFYCTICDIGCGNQFKLDIHENTTKHKINMRMKNSSGENVIHCNVPSTPNDKMNYYIQSGVPDILVKALETLTILVPTMVNGKYECHKEITIKTFDVCKFQLHQTFSHIFDKIYNHIETLIPISKCSMRIYHTIFIAYIKNIAQLHGINTHGFLQYYIPVDGKSQLTDRDIARYSITTHTKKIILSSFIDMFYTLKITHKSSYDYIDKKMTDWYNILFLEHIKNRIIDPSYIYRFTRSKYTDPNDEKEETTPHVETKPTVKERKETLKEAIKNIELEDNERRKQTTGKYWNDNLKQIVDIETPAETPIKANIETPMETFRPVSPPKIVKKISQPITITYTPTETPIETPIFPPTETTLDTTFDISPYIQYFELHDENENEIRYENMKHLHDYIRMWISTNNTQTLLEYPDTEINDEEVLELAFQYLIERICDILKCDTILMRVEMFQYGNGIMFFESVFLDQNDPHFVLLEYYQFVKKFSNADLLLNTMYKKLIDANTL